MFSKVPSCAFSGFWTLTLKLTQHFDLTYNLIKIKRRAKNDRQSAILDFISAKFVMGYPCVSPYILSSYFPLISSCINITKLLKFNMAARQPF